MEMLLIPKYGLHNLILGTTFEQFLIRRYIGLHAQWLKVSI